MSKASDSNPSPEFMKRCLPVMKQWEAGTLSFEDSLAQFNALREEAAHAQHFANQAQIEIMIGVMRGFRSELDLAIQHFRAARALFEQAGNKERVLLCDTNIAETYQEKGNLILARQTYNAAYLEAKRINSLRLQATCLGSMGHIALLQNAVEQARPVLEESVQLAKQTPERDRVLGVLCEAYRDLVNVYVAQKESSLAWEAARNALQAAQENQDLINLGQANRVIGELLTSLGPPADAAEGFVTDPDTYFQTAINYFREMKADIEIARILCVYGESLGKRGQAVNGARKVQQAARIFERLGLMSDAAKATELQGKILTGRFQN